MTTAHFDLAQAFLEGTSLTRQELDALVKSLKADKQFATARQVLDRVAACTDLTRGDDAATKGFTQWVQQQRALCTYKDADRPPLSRLREALGILRGIGLFDQGTTDPETLGLGGAIFKRFWEHEGNVAQLYSALSLYRAGWERNREQDAGYCGANAAFLLDKLAEIAERSANGTAGDTRSALQLRSDASALRKEILSFLDARSAMENGRTPNTWELLTRAELHFGLGNYDSAARLLRVARESGPEDWKSETSARQLIDLARCQGVNPSPVAELASAERQAWQAIEALLGADAEAVGGLVRGRVGLALSGGGLRASFYHLGVLARLAEADALRHVEAISTVSGGSIVGVLYYLRLKQLLESKSDLTIDREDYINLVRATQEEFFQATSCNLRMSTLASLWGNLRMLLPGYSRSHRIGELYEDRIYARADGTAKGRRIMSDLLICPAGHDPTRQFKPNDENWRRRAKVPVLLINSTSLNSGHNFQFTAAWMGEPPGLVGAEVDMNARYRPVRYSDAPTVKTRCYPLGHAVAASAGVPVLFEPLAIEGLYPGRTVLLVDGGVHDNQGVAGLLDQGCNFILCSDASGQMHDEAKPGNALLGTALRSDEIAQDRVREAEYADLAARERNGALRGLLFVHLKSGLDPESIEPVGTKAATPSPRANQTAYGIDRDIQRRLSEIRTDLDGFSEVEARTLMLSGYLATTEELRHENERHVRKGGTNAWGDFQVAAPMEKWSFLELQPIAAKPADTTDLRRRDLERQLAAGKSRFFKAFALVPWLRAVGAILVVAVLGLAVRAAFEFWDRSLLHLTWGQAIVGVVGLVLAFALPLIRFLNPQSAARGVLLKLALPVVGWVAANVHLLVVEPVFRRRGRVGRLMNLPTGDK